MNKKVYMAVTGGKSDHNINFRDFRNLIESLGFKSIGQKGSHSIYFNHALGEFMNIQRDGAKAKDYQVRQFRNIIKEHNL